LSLVCKQIFHDIRLKSIAHLALLVGRDFSGHPIRDDLIKTSTIQLIPRTVTRNWYHVSATVLAGGLRGRSGRSNALSQLVNSGWLVTAMVRLFQIRLSRASLRLPPTLQRSLPGSNCKHFDTIAARVSTPSFTKMRLRWVDTVHSLMCRSAAIC